mmetsp:Transcript_81926/g.240497  ORF Transcript_81926/g.240497 Transcript_81926/m.240497 type:complete len:217 (-) Transcript_81926:255-905(-)
MRCRRSFPSSSEGNHGTLTMTSVRPSSGCSSMSPWTSSMRRPWCSSMPVLPLGAGASMGSPATVSAIPPLQACGHFESMSGFSEHLPSFAHSVQLSSSSWACSAFVSGRFNDLASSSSARNLLKRSRAMVATLARDPTLSTPMTRAKESCKKAKMGNRPIPLPRSAKASFSSGETPKSAAALNNVSRASAFSSPYVHATDARSASRSGLEYPAPRG